MKKISILLFLITLSSFQAFAQEPKFIEDITVGAELGASIPTMRYSDQMYDFYRKSSLFSGAGGLYADWNFYDNWSLRPHLSFTGRGVNMEYSPFFIDYKLKSTYFDLRVPVTYTFNTNTKIQPFLAMGPSFNFTTGGKIHYEEGANDNSYDLKLAKSNFTAFDLGVYIGGGFGYPVQIGGLPFIVGAEVGYNLGMIDTFAKGEENRESIAVNTPIYDIEGTRKNSNVTIAAKISIPLKSLFSKKKRAKKQNYTPAPVSQIKENIVERKVTVQEKQCCSLEDMYDLILNGQDISTKKICAFDDITFDFDKASIRPESEKYLDKFVTILKKFPTLHLSIIGHTDNVGDSQYNMLLSKKRAEAVANYFIVNGIDQSRLRCYGYGSRQPLTDNSTSQARALNRRVEFDVIEGSF